MNEPKFPVAGEPIAPSGFRKACIEHYFIDYFRGKWHMPVPEPSGPTQQPPARRGDGGGMVVAATDNKQASSGKRSNARRELAAARVSWGQKRALP